MWLGSIKPFLITQCSSCGGKITCIQVHVYIAHTIICNILLYINYICNECTQKSYLSLKYHIISTEGLNVSSQIEKCE